MHQIPPIPLNTHLIVHNKPILNGEIPYSVKKKTVQVHAKLIVPYFNIPPQQCHIIQIEELQYEMAAWHGLNGPHRQNTSVKHIFLVLI